MADSIAWAIQRHKHEVVFEPGVCRQGLVSKVNLVAALVHVEDGDFAVTRTLTTYRVVDLLGDVFDIGDEVA